jgi:hypothetical protein
MTSISLIIHIAEKQSTRFGLYKTSVFIPLIDYADIHCLWLSHEVCSCLLNWDSFITLHIMCFCLMFQLWKHWSVCCSEHCWSALQTRETNWVGYIAVMLTCNRNKALVKSHGAWVNHVLYECSHASTNWKYALRYSTQPFLTTDTEWSLLPWK